MDRDEVLRLAREADPGFEGGPDKDGTLGDSLVGMDTIEQFAALVAAAEREACAQVCEDLAALRPFVPSILDCANAIRSRSK